MENNEVGSKNHSDFSIDHILNRAGSSSRYTNDESENKFKIEENFTWLQCTRFCPPKIPRVPKSREMPQKRQLGRYPRIPFTNEQLAVLERKFEESAYLSSEEALSISRRLQLSDAKVKIWFQNRRARKRREETGQSNKKEEKTHQSERIEGSGSRNSNAVVPFLYVNPHGLIEFGSS
ncbi:unnamed protein product [Phyllotreta striolata]|uniref:Homeobox domain-containing protein n=1 Tax=Phyllotreta striolata TaxID=444603 RepID=A0A9N9TKC7_PHYSR|nr:unnamed protein product [Phyllotreta striolata]